MKSKLYVILQNSPEIIISLIIYTHPKTQVKIVKFILAKYSQEIKPLWRRSLMT